LASIRADYNITIKYDRHHHGYFLDLAADEDLDDFNVFIRLLERRERLEALTQSGSAMGRYLQFEQRDDFRGLEWLALLWNALQRGLVVSFRYQNYADGPNEMRLVEPGLLFEYRNRWYIDGYDLNRQAGRTFGLDRISDLVLISQAIQSDRNIDYQTNRRHVIGVTSPPDAPVERVVLRFAKPEAEYVRSLPLHSSQEIVQETANYLDVKLHVVLNHELEREVLAYGEYVTVLKPETLRETIGTRVVLLQQKYETGDLR